MTATLTPAEQLEVTRFGVHDPDVIDHMETHWDDEARCDEADCDAGVTARVSLRCHPKTLNLCRPHFTVWRDGQLAWVADIARRQSKPRCVECGHVYPVGASFDDLFNVVWI